MVRLYEHVSHDVDDQAHSLEGWEQVYEQLGCGRFHGRTRQLLLPEGVLMRESTNRPLREEFAPPRDHMVLAVPLEVEPGSMYAGRPLLPGSLMLMFPGQEYDVVATGVLDHLSVAVHWNVIQSLEPATLDWMLGLRSGRAITLGEEAAAIARQRLHQAAAD